jgi:nucleoside-diphosphate-sugar epimerase
MHILVTGGTGFLGQHLVRALLASGHQVRVLGRDFRQVHDLIAAGAESVTVDLCDRPAVAAACAGVDSVYHVGAKSQPWGRRSDFLAVNVGGTDAVVEGCQQHGVRRLIYVSSPSVVFDGHDHIELTEAAPYPRHIMSVYSLSKKFGEDRVRAAAAGGLETVIVRPKAMFGPGDRALLPRLIAAARQGRLVQVGNGENLVDLTYVENVVDALVAAHDAPAAIGKIFTITNAEHVRLWDVIRNVLQRLGLPTALRRVPVPLALLAARAMEARAWVDGREPLLTAYSAAILARTQTYDIRAARRDLGYVPRVSIAEGIERTLAALGETAGEHRSAASTAGIDTEATPARQR